VGYSEPPVTTIAPTTTPTTIPYEDKYDFVGGCKEGKACSGGFNCGRAHDRDLSGVSFEKCLEHAIYKRTAGFAYIGGNPTMKDAGAGVCVMCVEDGLANPTKNKGMGIYAATTQCVDTNRFVVNGNNITMKDEHDQGCEYYRGHVSNCGYKRSVYKGFDASKMCCACDGGSREKRKNLELLRGKLENAKEGYWYGDGLEDGRG